MKHITIAVPDNKFPFTVDLLKNLKFIKTVKTSEDPNKAPTKEEFIQDLKEAAEEVKLIKAGKKKAPSFEEFLNEL
jgi:uncharacterized protein YlbG (UPF0298 family)